MNQADTAWMLVSTALVLLMTPALAFFYGGLVRSKNALNCMMMSFISLGFVGVLWATVGYSLAFAPGNNWIGDLSRLFLEWRRAGGAGHDPALPVHELPGDVRHHHGGPDLGRDCRAHALLGVCRLHFVVGGRRLQPDRALGMGRRLAGRHGRTRFCRRHGRARQRGRRRAGRRDRRRPSPRFQGGAAAVRTTCRSRCSAPVSSGSDGSDSTPAAPWGQRPSASLAFTTTFLAPMGTLVVWTILDSMRSGKPTAVGAATAIVVGLVAVTPAAGFIGPMSAIALGAIAAVPSYFGLVWRANTQLDDSLDVVAAHGVGGTVGALLTGVFAQREPERDRRCERVAVRQAGATRHPGNRRRCGDRLQRRHELRAAESHRARHPAPRVRRGRGCRASTSPCTGKKRTCMASGGMTTANAMHMDTPSPARSGRQSRTRRWHNEVC